MSDHPDDQPTAPEPEVQLAHLGHLGDDEGPALRTALEAILMVVDEPVSEVLLAQVTERPTEEVLEALRGLATEYDEAGRGFELRQVAGGWRYYTRSSCAAYVERFVLEVSRRASPRLHWRRSPSWRTASRSAGRGSRPSAASMSTE
jgi:hypothetical protein